MSIVNIRNVEFLNNPAKFSDPYKFKVTFECIAPLPDDLEWKLIYVSSPVNRDLDQELDDCCIGPVPIGINAFTFEAEAPDPKIIPKEDVLGLAALILTGSYRDQEFVRIGYYQNTEYEDEQLAKEPPSTIIWERLVRSLTDKPWVTRFSIKWDVTLPQQLNANGDVRGSLTSPAVPPAKVNVAPTDSSAPAKAPDAMDVVNS